jgi:hypothetical protein
MLKKLLPFVIIFASLAVFVMLRMARPEAEQSEPQQLLVVVDAMTVTVDDATITVASQGTVEPRTSTNLVSEVAGQVVEVSPAFVAGGFSVRVMCCSDLMTAITAPRSVAQKPVWRLPAASWNRNAARPMLPSVNGIA